MKRILVPTNCEKASENAFRLATEFSKITNARVYLLRVVKTHGGAYFDDDGEIVQDHAHDVQQYKDEKKRAVEKLSEWVDNINPDAYQVVKYGGIADVILETINKYEISLVILGNTYVSDAKNRFFGDLTSFLINKSKAPILSLKSAISLDDLNHVVFANEFDGKVSYYDALQDIHNSSNTSVDMLHVKTKDSAAEEEIHENMDYFARMNMIKNYSKNVHHSSTPEQGILEWISDHPCDLLAVKNITKKGASPLFRPKLSQQFLRKSSISTLIYND